MSTVSNRRTVEQGRDRGTPPFAVVVVDAGHEVVAFVDGEIDLATCEHLRESLEPHLRPGQLLALDLSGVTFMDSTCISVLQTARMRLSGTGGSLALRNPSHAARRLITAAGLTKQFPIEIG
jgi:stage II sporulation protein AA (anti-sigma F factor antagonist)